uniref:Uncharacterized protein n=1 Tax=Panagrolaimus superbus TaxID=310955 RepID=A0A914Z2R7_9BILA
MDYGNQGILQRRPPPPRWNIESQIVEKAQQTIIHAKTPVTPEISRNDLIVKNKIENIQIPKGAITNYSEQTISQAAIPAISNPSQNQVITKSHIETIRPSTSGQSYGSSMAFPNNNNNNNIPSMDVRISPGSMPMVPASVVPLSSGSIGRYETNIGRYDTGEGRQNYRFEIPQTFLQNIQNKIPGIVETETYRSNLGTSYGPINSYRQSPYGSNTGLPTNYIPNTQPFGNQQFPPPPHGTYIPTGYQQKPSIEDSVNTRILTNEQFQPNIIPEPNTIIFEKNFFQFH